MLPEGEQVGSKVRSSLMALLCLKAPCYIIFTVFFLVTSAWSLSVTVVEEERKQANPCKLFLSAGDNMQFSSTQMSAPAACDTLVVTFVHTGKLPKRGMGHNWVLTTKSLFREVAADGVAAGLENDFIKRGDERVIAYTKLVGGGESASTVFSTSGLRQNEEYVFFCSYPGHWGIMKGTFTLT